MSDAYTPMYVVIQNYIIEKINSGVLKPGDKIPSENELTKMFGVSRVTVNSAITQLNLQGVVTRVKGKGTYVKTPERMLDNPRESNIHSFKISSKGHDDQHKLLDMQILDRDGAKTRLVLLPGEKYHKITRLMYSNEKAIAVDYSYLPYSFYPKEIDRDLIEDTYLHVFIKEHCGKTPNNLHTHINIVFPDGVAQAYLGAQVDEPILSWSTLVMDRNDMVLGYTDTYARPDDYRPYMNFML